MQLRTCPELNKRMFFLFFLFVNESVNSIVLNCGFKTSSLDRDKGSVELF